MIRTQQTHIPWFWVGLLGTTTGVMAYIDCIGNTALTFTLRKFTSDPMLIALIGSVHVAFNCMVAPYVSWKSDHIWTRLGRRLPFVLGGSAILILGLIAAPCAPTLWILIPIFIVWQFGQEIGFIGPWSPLFYETVPSNQRGRANMIRRIFGMGATLFFSYFLIGRFDSIYNLTLHFGFGPFPVRITGEQMIYWIGALMVASTAITMLGFLRETKPKHMELKHRFTPMGFLKETFADRQFVLIYMLLYCMAAMTMTLGQLDALLYTEQFGMSKQDLGLLKSAMMISGILLITPVCGFLADRYDRLVLFKIGIVLCTLHALGYFAYVKFVAPLGVPSFTALLVIRLLHGVMEGPAVMAIEPYFFDLVPRNKMGTINSGFLLVNGVLRVFMGVSVGVWVKYYSKLFASPGKFDYMSGYILVFLLGLLAICITFYFQRQRKLGRIIEYGKLEEKGVDVG